MCTFNVDKHIKTICNQKHARTVAMHSPGQIRHTKPDVYDALGGSTY